MSNPIAAASESEREILGAAAASGQNGKPRSLGRDAWHELIRRPLFVVAAILIILFLLMAVFPQLFTSTDPRACDLGRSRLAPSSAA